MLTGEEIDRFVGHQGSVMQIIYRWSNRVIYSLSNDKTIRMWNVDTKEEIR